MAGAPIKMYKLIPMKDFEKSDLNKEPKCDKENDKPDEKPTVPQRSIQDIVDANSLENTEFEPSKHYVAEQKFIQKGSGTTPIWLPNERQLPQFSRGSRIKKSYDDISNILNDNSISDDLKVRLYTMFRQKYNNARNVRESDEDDGLEDDEDLIVKRKSKQRELVGALRDIAEKLPAGKKQRNAFRIIHILTKNKRHLRWDFDGTIIHPPHRDLEEIGNMKKFFEIILYKNKGSPVQVEVVADLIKPFFREMEQFIENEKVVKKLAKGLKNKGNLPQYVSWYKMWNK